jgi:hypothetical protein
MINFSSEQARPAHVVEIQCEIDDEGRIIRVMRCEGADPADKIAATHTRAYLLYRRLDELVAPAPSSETGSTGDEEEEVCCTD